MRFFGSWGAIALRGVAAILFGFLALRVPLAALVAMTLLFGLYVLTDGVLAIVAAVRAGRHHERVAPLAIEGLLGIVAGLAALLWPGLGTVTLLFLIAAWAMAAGSWKMAAAISLRKEMEHAWLLGISGLLALLFGLAVILFPGAGALAAATVIGIYGLLHGMFLLNVAFRMHQFSRQGPVAVS